MTSALAVGPRGSLSAVTLNAVGAQPNRMMSHGKFRLATDPLGSTTVTLTNIVVGSRYRIERQSDGSLATPTANAEGVAAATTVVITLDYYSAGSASNDLKAKVRKGTAAPKYQPFESLFTAGSAASTVYVAQVADTIA